VFLLLLLEAPWMDKLADIHTVLIHDTNFKSTTMNYAQTAAISWSQTFT